MSYDSGWRLIGFSAQNWEGLDFGEEVILPARRFALFGLNGSGKSSFVRLLRFVSDVTALIPWSVAPETFGISRCEYGINVFSDFSDEDTQINRLDHTVDTYLGVTPPDSSDSELRVPFLRKKGRHQELWTSSSSSEFSLTLHLRTPAGLLCRAQTKWRRVQWNGIETYVVVAVDFTYDLVGTSFKVTLNVPPFSTKLYFIEESDPNDLKGPLWWFDKSIASHERPEKFEVAFQPILGKDEKVDGFARDFMDALERTGDHGTTPSPSEDGGDSCSTGFDHSPVPASQQELEGIIAKLDEHLGEVMGPDPGCEDEYVTYYSLIRAASQRSKSAKVFEVLKRIDPILSFPTVPTAQPNGEECFDYQSALRLLEKQTEPLTACYYPNPAIRRPSPPAYSYRESEKHDYEILLKRAESSTAYSKWRDESRGPLEISPVSIGSYCFDVKMNTEGGVAKRIPHLVKADAGSSPPVVYLHQTGRGIAWQFGVLMSAIQGARYFEHPEHYLHPRAAADLAEALVRVTPFCVLETHSEAVLLRLQRMVRKGWLQPDGVNIIVFDQKKEASSTGACHLKQYAIEKDGSLRLPFPDGFAEIYWEEQGEHE